MVKFKDILKPTGKIKIEKCFVNSKTKQMSVILPKKKMKGVVPKRIEILYWK